MENLQKKKNDSELIPKPKTSFLKVKCASCGSEQKIFSAASRKVNCLACNKTLAEPAASKVKMKTTTIEVLK